MAIRFLDLRILPVAMVAAAIGLLLRVAGMTDHRGAPASAQTAPVLAVQLAQVAPSAPAPQAAPTATPTPPRASPPPATERPREAPRAPALDPDQLTQAELEILQELASRRGTLDRQAQEVAQREALLQAAERRIDAKLQELRQLQTSVEGVLRRSNEEETQRLRSLVRMFEAMRPPEAARIFEQMELSVLVEIVERMREAKAAPVLAQMSPVRARQLTGELARRRPPAPAENAVTPAPAARGGAG
jgi:flagellar motility protein MotE (MotC chaperone)